ncbi:hypothetical protein H3T12_08420 [Streptomyces sp. GMR22]|nr:hypothetical protein [Streptomyces sp. GMR22]
MVLVDQEHAHVVAVAAQQPGQFVFLRGCQEPVQGDGMDGPAGHRDGGGWPGRTPLAPVPGRIYSSKSPLPARLVSHTNASS